MTQAHYAIDTVLRSARFVALDASVTTAPAYERDTGSDDDGTFFLNDDQRETLNLETAVRIGGHAYHVHFIREDRGLVHLQHVHASGIACVWLAALDLFGVRMNFEKPTNAAFELEAWLDGEGAGTEVGRFIAQVEQRLQAVANTEAMLYDAKHPQLEAA